MENVASEVTQQVHRLSWHPSVAAWSGNNEIEGSLGWYSETRTNKQLFAGDYIALFVDTIRNIIKQVRNEADGVVDKRAYLAPGSNTAGPAWQQSMHQQQQLCHRQTPRAHTYRRV